MSHLSIPGHDYDAGGRLSIRLDPWYQDGPGVRREFNRLKEAFRGTEVDIFIGDRKREQPGILYPGGDEYYDEVDILVQSYANIEAENKPVSSALMENVDTVFTEKERGALEKKVEFSFAIVPQDLPLQVITVTYSVMINSEDSIIAQLGEMKNLSTNQTQEFDPSQWQAVFKNQIAP